MRTTSAPAPNLKEELVRNFSAALGEAKAQQVVSEAVEQSGFAAASLTQKDALAVLDRIAQSPGIVGIAARFIKSRYLLRP
ncbi:MAG TPA: hypothetical protein VF989_18180 [Polyangiaceae bacterium]|jgi:hypothetical protein